MTAWLTSTRRLTQIAIGGMALSLLCFSASCALLPESGSDTIRRELPWDGSQALAIEVPADVRFTQAPGPGKVIAFGPRRSVETLRIRGGHISDGTPHTGGKLLILVSAPEVTHFFLEGRDNLRITGFDQPVLHVDTTGRAVVEASGRTDAMKLQMQGLSSGDFSALHAERVDLHLQGATRVTLSAHDTVAGLAQGLSHVILSKPVTRLDVATSGAAAVEGPPSDAAEAQE